jgi:hypothetical protein
MKRAFRVGFAMLLCAFPGIARAHWPIPALPPQPATPADQAATSQQKAEATVAAPVQAPVNRPPGVYPPPPPRWADQPPLDYPFAAANVAAPVAPPPVAAAAQGAAQAQEEGEPQAIHRRFSFTAAIGPGALIGPGENALAVSYQVARGAVGLDRNLALWISYEGAGTSSVNPKTNLDSWLKQEIVSLGLQHHIEQRFYVRGGLGAGFVSEKTKAETFSGGKGIAALAAFGYELIQRKHLAVALDLHVSWTHYPKESWKTLGADVAISLF